MVISLPVPEALQKDTAEKTIEITLPLFTAKLTDSKIVSAFKTVLQSPVN